MWSTTHQLICMQWTLQDISWLVDFMYETRFCSAAKANLSEDEAGKTWHTSRAVAEIKLDGLLQATSYLLQGTKEGIWLTLLLLPGYYLGRYPHNEPVVNKLSLPPILFRSTMFWKNTQKACIFINPPPHTPCLLIECRPPHENYILLFLSE